MDDEEDPGFRRVGAEILCPPDVADDIAQQLREAVGEILDHYTDTDVFDYGVDRPRTQDRLGPPAGDEDLL